MEMLGYSCNIEQYYILRQRSIDKNMTKWNQWRKQNRNVEIYFQGCDFNNF